uniref:Uncharacterized protein n=1 Tax=Solanum lycopersicum TaxID=4081 RepID=A0A3Q7FYY3_SOLLC
MASWYLLGPCFYCHVESPINEQSAVVVPSRHLVPQTTNIHFLDPVDQVIEDACEEEYKGEGNLTYSKVGYIHVLSGAYIWSTIDNDIHGGSISWVLGKKTIVSKSSRDTWYDKVQTCGNLIDH